jgi:4-amino-4-deoxy-L-arabinose transferase-like glycosyltransferase
VTAVFRRIAIRNIESFRLRPTDNLVPVALVFLTTIAMVLSLFVLRSFDDNRLTSWQWVFADINAIEFSVLLSVGLFVAYALSKMSLSERKPAVFLFLLSFAVGMTFWREPEVVVDASRYFIQAKYLELYGIGYFFEQWGKDVMAWTDMPLIPFFYGLIFSLFGESRTNIQVFTTLLFSGTVVFTYLIGKTLWDKSTGFYAGALLLGMPYLLTQVPLMLVDIPTMFFLTLAVFLTIKAVKQGRPHLVALACLAIASALFSKYSTWVMLSVVVPVIVLSHLKLDRKAVLQRGFMIAVGSALLMLLVVLLKFNTIIEQLRLLHDYQMPALGGWRESVFSTLFFQIHPFVAVGAALSVYLAFRKKDEKYIIMGWMALLFMALGIARIRYALIMFPMLALMAAYGFRMITDVEVRRMAVWSTAISGLIIAMFAYLPFLEKTSAGNIREAGRYINSIEARKIEVFALPQQRSYINPAVSVALLDLFTKKEIVYHDSQNFVPPPKLIASLPLRWTWEYKTPRYFNADTSGSEEDVAIVLILSDRQQVLPRWLARRIVGYRLSRELGVVDKVFRYKTIVRVYQRI